MTNKNAAYPNKECSTIILAGGRSSRMSYPKAWLKFNNQFTFLEHTVNTYLAFGCKHVIVVLNNDFYDSHKVLISKIEKKVTIIKNHHPEKGRLHSIRLGINKLDRIGLTYIHNIDNPFIDKETLSALKGSSISGYVRPTYNLKSGHPILVTNGVLENIIHADDETILRDLLKEHRVDEVPVKDDMILVNINTPNEYEKYFNMKVPEFKNPPNESIL